jgi:hypothetical protein
MTVARVLIESAGECFYESRKSRAISRGNFRLSRYDHHAVWCGLHDLSISLQRAYPTKEIKRRTSGEFNKAFHGDGFPVERYTVVREKLSGATILNYSL